MLREREQEGLPRWNAVELPPNSLEHQQKTRVLLQRRAPSTSPREHSTSNQRQTKPTQQRFKIQADNERAKTFQTERHGTAYSMHARTSFARPVHHVRQDSDSVGAARNNNDNDDGTVGNNERARTWCS